MVEECRGELDVYGLPDRIGGWIVASVPMTLVALLDGIEVGRVSAEEDVEGGSGRRGFSLDFDRPVEPGAVRSGSLEVRPMVGGAVGEALRPGSTLLGVDVLLASFADITTWRQRLGPDYPGIVRNLFAWHPSRVDKAILQPIRPAERPGAKALAVEPSPLSFAPGLVSMPGDAVLGHGGFVFLTGGSNSVMAQYTLPLIGEEHRALAQCWSALFRRRSMGAAARRMAYVQTILPEKISALPEMFPGLVQVPTATLHVLEAALQADPVTAPAYLSGLATLRTLPDPRAMFRPVDSHLTPEGAFIMAMALRQRIEPCGPSTPLFDAACTMAADLGDRFFDQPILDLLRETRDPTVLGKVAPELVEQVVPDTTIHRGWRQVWRCPDAPVRKTLIVFGNSFCNFATCGQGYLSFWLARWFTEFHFIWSPAIEWSYAEAHGADVVVGQTIERFLGDVPAS